MHIAYFIPSKQSPMKGPTTRLLSARKKYGPESSLIIPCSSDLSYDQDGVTFQNLMIRNGREENSDGKKIEFPSQVRDFGTKVRAPPLEPESFRKGRNLNNQSIEIETFQTPQRSRPFSYHLRSRGSDGKKILSMKNETRHNSSLNSEKTKEMKILRSSFNDTRNINADNSLEVDKDNLRKLMFTSPDSKLKKSLQLENVQSRLSNNRYQAQSVNCSLDPNNFSDIKDLEGQKSNLDELAFDPDMSSGDAAAVVSFKRSSRSSHREVENDGEENENMNGGGGLAQRQRQNNLYYRSLEQYSVINSDLNSLQSKAQGKNFKIKNFSFRKHKIRPPTSPVHLVSDGNHLQLRSCSHKERPDEEMDVVNPVILQNRSLTPINDESALLKAFTNLKPKKQYQNPMIIFPTRNQRKEEYVEKIAEIKQHILLSEFKMPSRSENKKLIEEENLIMDDNMSQDNDGFFYEEEEEVEDTLASTSPENKKVTLLESVYSGRPPTVFFPYPDCCEETRNTARTFVVQPDEEKTFDLKYKSGTVLCVTRTFENAGFKRTADNSWNALWGKPKYNRVKDMNKYQKANHFPGCWEIGRKDGLWRNLSKFKRQFPQDYNFVPSTYLLSTDFDRFMQAKEAADPKAIWIMKPCASACGRGIKLIGKRTKLLKKTNYLVSEYISNPHLIDGYKYDLRVYVLVSCYDPLRVYLFEEGLVRFATEKYNTAKQSLKERFIHLTNWSVNKHSENFIVNTGPETDGKGSKWSFAALRKKFEEMGINHEEIFEKIKDIAIKTIIAVEPFMLNSLSRTPEHRNNCFELYGFDILLDSNLKPWLMEVNVCPSLNSSSHLDKKIKTTLICDIMNLVGFQPYAKKRFEDDLKKRLFGIEGKKHSFKSTIEISDLNEQNCLEKLSAEDWNILFETDEENYRRGNFERIFPLKENLETYSKFFEFQRYSNIIVWQWLRSKTNFLEKISQKINNIPV